MKTLLHRTLHFSVGILLAGTPFVSVLAADDPGGPAMYQQLILRMQQQGSWYASLAHINAWRQQYGDSPALQLAQADALRQTGQAAEARSIYTQLLRGPHQAAALNGLGLIDAERGEMKLAIERLRKASMLEPLNIHYLGDLGFALILSGDYTAARLPLAQALELSPQDGKSIANAALWQLLSGHEAQGMALLRQSNLPTSTHDQILATVERLRLEHAVALPESSNTVDNHVSASSRTVDEGRSPSMLRLPAAPGDVSHTGADAAAGQAEQQTPAAPFLPRAPMLEHFASSLQQGSQP